MYFEKSHSHKKTLSERALGQVLGQLGMVLEMMLALVKVTMLGLVLELLGLV